LCAAVREFIFPKAPCAYLQTIVLAFHPNDYKKPGKFIDEVLAFRAQGPDAKDAALVNRAPDAEPATSLTDILHLRPLSELEA